MRLHSFQGIQGLPQMPVGVNHVSGMKCQLCAGKHKKHQSNPLQHNAGADVLIRKKAKDAKSGQQGSLQTCWHHIGRLYLAGSGKQKGASPRRPVPAAVSSQAWGRALQLPKQTLEEGGQVLPSDPRVSRHPEICRVLAEVVRGLSEKAEDRLPSPDAVRCNRLIWNSFSKRGVEPKTRSKGDQEPPYRLLCRCSLD